MPDIIEPITFWYTVAIVITLVTAVVRRLVRFFQHRKQQAAPVEGPAGAGAHRAVFTLIHGTWARNAEWTNPGSPLRKQIRETCPSAGFRSFQWSGRNSERARRSAAKELRTFVEAGLSEAPDARHFVVAHSHGGNIALALGADITSRIEGIICLATPVIVSRKKQLDRFSTFFLRWFAVPPSMIAAGFAEEYWRIEDGWLIMSALAVSIIFSIWLRRRPRFDLTDLPQASISSDKMLFIRHSGDEASLSIGASNVAVLALEKLILAPMEGLSSAKESLDRIRPDLMRGRPLPLLGCVLLGVALYFSGPLLLGLPWSPRSEAIGVIILWSIISWIIVAIKAHTFVLGFIGFALAAFILPFILIFVVLITAMALGPELGLAVTTNHVTVEVCPHGTWQVAHIARDSDDSGEDVLQHSRVYTSPVSLRVLGDWVAAKLGRAV